MFSLTVLAHTIVAVLTILFVLVTPIFCICFLYRNSDYKDLNKIVNYVSSRAGPHIVLSLLGGFIVIILYQTYRNWRTTKVISTTRNSTSRYSTTRNTETTLNIVTEEYTEELERLRTDVNIVRTLRRLDKVVYILKREGVKQMNKVLDGFIDTICEENQTIRVRLEEKVLGRINRFYKLSEKRKIILVSQLRQLFEKTRNADMVVEVMRQLFLKRNKAKNSEIWSVTDKDYKNMMFGMNEKFWSLFKKEEKKYEAIDRHAERRFHNKYYLPIVLQKDRERRARRQKRSKPSENIRRRRRSA